MHLCVFLCGVCLLMGLVGVCLSVSAPLSQNQAGGSSARVGKEGPHVLLPKGQFFIVVSEGSEGVVRKMFHMAGQAICPWAGANSLPSPDRSGWVWLEGFL